MGSGFRSLDTLIRPPELRRAWLFVPGLDEMALSNAASSGADAIVADLEEMTAKADRPQARARIVQLLNRARENGDKPFLGAVRINKLSEDGLDDLRGVMPGQPAAIFLPHSETAAQMQELEQALTEHESILGLVPGSTEIVPTIESAKGLVNLHAILASTARIRCSMLAVEDLADSFGAIRSPQGIELLHARNRFMIDCKAAGCTPIDLPCTYRSKAVFLADLETGKQLGYTAKCAVFLPQVDLIQNAFRPSIEAVSDAAAVIAQFQAQTGKDYREDAPWIDSPVANNARRLLARHAAFLAFGADSSELGDGRG